MTTCRECDEGLDHCHETLVEHRGGWVECPDPACGADRLGHAWVMACVEAGGAAEREGGRGGASCPVCGDQSSRAASPAGQAGHPEEQRAAA